MHDEKDAAGSHFIFDARDLVMPCPFCGESRKDTDPHSREQEGIQLTNTHTAHYTVRCTCGAEIDGDSTERGRIGKTSVKKHLKAAQSALTKWNTRVLPLRS